MITAEHHPRFRPRSVQPSTAMPPVVSMQAEKGRPAKLRPQSTDPVGRFRPVVEEE